MKTTILVLLGTIGAMAFAGTVGGGGGGAYRCAPDDVELVDLFEAETMGFHIDYKNPATLDVQLATAIDRVKQISPLFGTHVEYWINYLQDEKHLGGGPGTFVPKPDDVDPHYGKKDKGGNLCELVGMMYFDDHYNKLVRDTNIFNLQRTTVEYAASYVHEAVYKVMRDQNMPGGVNSVLTRQIVACVMSDADLGDCMQLTKTVPVTGDDTWKCDVVNKDKIPISFTIYNLTYGWHIQIDKYDGRDIQFQSRSIYFKEGMIGSFDDPRVGVYTADPDVGPNFDYLKGLWRLGLVVRNMLPEVDIMEPRLKVRMPGTKEIVACKPMGKVPKPGDELLSCKVTPALRKCISDMEKKRGSKWDGKKASERGANFCRFSLKNGDSCACSQDAPDLFSWDPITCTGPL